MKATITPPPVPVIRHRRRNRPPRMVTLEMTERQAQMLMDVANISDQANLEATIRKALQKHLDPTNLESELMIPLFRVLKTIFPYNCPYNRIPLT